LRLSSSPKDTSNTQCNKNSSNSNREDYESGNYYIGEFNEKGEQHGQGTFTWVSGQKYVGRWENGNPSGQGKMTYEDGAIYEGTWNEGDE
jgi:hypothetical protein